MQSQQGRWTVLAGVWLVYVAFGATAASLAPVLPEVRETLGIGNTTLGAILGAWPLVYIFVAIPAGGFLDWAGPRLGLVIAALFIAASALLRGMAGSPETMLFAVALFGVGGPLISVGAPKIISALFEGPARGTAIGIYFTGPALGGVAALTLTNDLLIPLMGDWRGVMRLHAGFAALAGALWLLATLGTRLTPASGGRERFSLVALRELIAHREMQLLLGLALGGFFINHALNNWLAAILRDKGMAAATAGYWAAIPMLVGLAAGLTIPRLATPERRFAILVTLYAMAMATSLAVAHASGPVLFAALALQGVVRGAMNSIVVLVMTEMRAIPGRRMGLASGLYFTAGEIGGVLGPVGMGALRDVTGGYAAPLHALALAAGGMIVLALVLSQQMKRPG